MKQIRQAIMEDMAEIKACATAAYSKYISRIGREPAPALADFAKQIADGIVYVIGEDGAVDGYVVFYPRDDHLHLESVAVFPRKLGEGLGGRLIAFVEEEARRQGLAAVELYTNTKMTENLKMYRKLGYEELGRRHQEGYDRAFFRKNIGAG